MMTRERDVEISYHRNHHRRHRQRHYDGYVFSSSEADIVSALNRILVAIIALGIMFALIFCGTNSRLDRMNDISDQSSGSIRF